MGSGCTFFRFHSLHRTGYVRTIFFVTPMPIKASARTLLVHPHLVHRRGQPVLPHTGDPRLDRDRFRQKAPTRFAGSRLIRLRSPWVKTQGCLCLFSCQRSNGYIKPLRARTYLNTTYKTMSIVILCLFLCVYGEQEENIILWNTGW